MQRLLFSEDGRSLVIILYSYENKAPSKYLKNYEVTPQRSLGLRPGFLMGGGEPSKKSPELFPL